MINRASDVGQWYAFDDVPMRLESPSVDVRRAIDRIMRRPFSGRDLIPNALTIRTEHADNGWTIRANDEILEVLASATAIPAVAEATILQACAMAAERTRSTLVRGAVLERDGRGLLLVGDDRESAMALAFHLHARRWTGVSFRYGFLDPATLEVVGLETLAAIGSNTIGHIPNVYRKTIEKSNWYQSGDDLTFYAVDPHAVHPKRAHSTRLSSVVVVDGESNDRASLGACSGSRASAFLERHPLADSVRVAKITLGSPIASCDLIERWATGSEAID